MEKTLEIGIIGGCMTCQTDLKLSQLFYRSFSQTLLENESVKCFVSLKYYNEYYKIPEYASMPFNKTKPGLVIIQVRPAPFVMRSEFLIQDYRGHFILNPLIANPGNFTRLETILGTKDPVMIKPGQIRGFFRRTFIMAVLRLNYLLGRIFGLQRRALNSIAGIMDQAIVHCRQNEISLLVIGPLNSASRASNAALRRLNRSLRHQAERNGMGYIDIYSFLDKHRDRFFTSDQHHLNAEGHKQVSSMLYEEFKKIGGKMEYSEKS
jgi:hypothetical protein